MANHAPALCNEQNFTTMLQKKVICEVNALEIRCPQKELGCEWEGEIGQLQRHLYPEAKLVIRDVRFLWWTVAISVEHNCSGD